MSEAIAKVRLTIEVPDFKPALRHDIKVELQINHRGGVTIVTGDLPRKSLHDPSVPVRFVGSGVTFLGAVLDWLKLVDNSMAYLPAHDAEEPGVREDSKTTKS